MMEVGPGQELKLKQMREEYKAFFIDNVCKGSDKTQLLNKN